jgi:uncharacterized protein (DUF169 family)
MNDNMMTALSNFLKVLGIDEEPMGIFYTDEKPAEGLSPEPNDLPTREKEMKNEIDWQKVFGQFSCVIGHIWRARKKKATAYFSAEQFGCPGGAFWLGFNKPQLETMLKYISTGIPNWTEGELYCDSPDELRQIFEYVDPRPAPHKFCVVKPVSQFSNDEMPELIVFFSRPESLAGLNQLATFVTNDPEVVVSPWGPGCGSIVAWPLHYLSKGQNKAVIGGWDPSARKFFKNDELSFTVPFQMFRDMINRYGESFLTTKTWETVQKKIERSKKAWGEKS